jgi:hypothetical protein
MGPVKLKPIWTLFWVKKKRLLKQIHMCDEVGNSSMHQPMDCICKEFFGLLMEPLHHLGTGGRIISYWILGNLAFVVWIGFIWLRIWSSGGLF